MFQDLDSTLKKILDDAAMKTPPIVPPLAELLAADVTFITPDKNFVAADPKPAVNLFLYDVKENRDLRDPTPIIEKVGNGFRRRQPPVRVDCSYIVTAWSKLTNENQVVEEHRLLAQALLWLTRFPTIPSNYLQGTLANQLYPPQMWVAQIDPNKNAGEFWDALAIPPRPAFYLTVTIGMELGLQDTGALVTTRFTGIDPGTGTVDETLVQIGGRVLGPPVTVVRAQATLVNASGNQATVTTAADLANFRPGDIVLLEQGATRERATIAGISGVTITFQTNLVNTFGGGIIRIADLSPGQRIVRVAGTGGLEPGTAVFITQGPIVEEANVQSVERATNSIILTRGLFGAFTMAATDAPVNLIPGIADALVDIVDAGLRTRSESSGRYSFPRVPVGTRTIRAVAVGFEPKTQSLPVPGLPENYEINMTPL
jgi:Pvc16 N-terminal domain